MTEPVSINELKKHLRLTETVGAVDEVAISIPLESHVPGSVTGGAVDVLYSRSVVSVTPGAISATATVVIVIQESDSELTGYTTWHTFATQTDAWVDPLVKEYTGQKSYIRVTATVANASAVFGATINTLDTEDAEDEFLGTLITTAREMVEQECRRALLTQTKTYAIHDFPASDGPIELPFGNLQSITSIVYTDSEGTETTMDSADYRIQDRGIYQSRLYPAYDTEWPEYDPPPGEGIVVTFVCGYGDNPGDVPSALRTAIKMLCSDLYYSRGEIVKDARTTVYENKTVNRILKHKKFNLQRYL